MICCTNANDILHSVSRHVSLQQEQHLHLEHGWLLRNKHISLFSDTKWSTIVVHWNKLRMASQQEGENDEIMHMFAASSVHIQMP
jgi:hypothetical protein